MGAGRTELMRAVFGLDPLRLGRNYHRRQKSGAQKTRAMPFKRESALLPRTARMKDLCSTRPSRENIALPNLASFSPKGWIDKKSEQEFVDLTDQAADDQNGIAGNPRAKPYQEETSKK